LEDVARVYPYRLKKEIICQPGALMTTERIKLCLVTNLFYPIPAGGAERFRRYAPGLRERGIDLEVITSLPSGYADLKEHEIVDGIPIIRLPLADPLKDFPQLMKFALKQFQKLLLIIFRGFQIIHG